MVDVVTETNHYNALKKKREPFSSEPKMWNETHRQRIKRYKCVNIKRLMATMNSYGLQSLIWRIPKRVTLSTTNTVNSSLVLSFASTFPLFFTET